MCKIERVIVNFHGRRNKMSEKYVKLVCTLFTKKINKENIKHKEHLHIKTDIVVNIVRLISLRSHDLFSWIICFINNEIYVQRAQILEKKKNHL